MTADVAHKILLKILSVIFNDPQFFKYYRVETFFISAGSVLVG